MHTPLLYNLSKGGDFFMKKWLTRILLIFSLFIILIFLTPILLKSNGYTYVIGRYIPASNHQHMIISKYGSKDGKYIPDYMTCDNNKLYHNLTVGDKILIIIPNGIRNDILPGNVYVYYGIKLSDGTINDIPSKMIRYVDNTEYQTVSISNDLINISFKIPEKWSYAPLPANQGISIFPTYERKGSVDLYCTDDFSIDTMNNYRIDTGKLDYFDYDVTRYYHFDSDFVPTSKFFDLRAWDYICFSEPYDTYILYNNGAEIWSSEYNLQLQDILNTLEFQ